MRDKLLDEIILTLVSNGLDADLVKSRLTILLNDYDITSRCTEISVVNEDDISKYIRLFLINKRVSGRTDRTIKYYKTELERFFREVSKSPIEITSDDIKLFLATKEVRDGVSKVYQKNIMRVISSFYQFMTKEEYILKNPMNKVDDIKIPKKKKHAFTELEIEQLRYSIKDDIRLMCIFELFLSTWCRVSELCLIKRSDISENMEEVLVHGKGEKDRVCYINSKAKLCLCEYLKKRKDNNEYLFPECSIKVNDPNKIFSTECKNIK